MSGLQRLGITFPYMVAPMVGLSHVAMRELVRSYLPPDVQALRFTEMLSTRRLPGERLGASNELRYAQGESHFVPQLLGNDEEFIAKSIRRLLPAKPWGFDINMGCPVKHTLRHNWGVRLMGDAPYAAKVVAMTKRHSPLPVSVKMRGGIDKLDTDYLTRFTDELEKAGADWLTIHPRSRAQKHSGEADWQMVAELKARRSVPVVTNGNIQTADDAIRVVENFGVDGAMIGRAITARPWLLGQIAQKTGLGGIANIPETPEEESREYFRALDRLGALMDQYFAGEDYKLQKMRFFVATGSKWFLFGHSFWKYCMKKTTFAELRERIAEYGAKHQYPIRQRIEL